MNDMGRLVLFKDCTGVICFSANSLRKTPLADCLHCNKSKHSARISRGCRGNAKALLLQPEVGSVPEIAVLGSQEDPLFTGTLSEALGLVVLNNPFDSFADETRAASNKDDRFSRHFG